MITEDVSVPIDGSWTMIPLTTAQTILFNNNDGVLLVRFGASSTSSGFRLISGETIICTEAVYVKPTLKYATADTAMTITVTR